MQTGFSYEETIQHVFHIFDYSFVQDAISFGIILLHCVYRQKPLKLQQKCEEHKPFLFTILPLPFFTVTFANFSF